MKIPASKNWLKRFSVRERVGLVILLFLVLFLFLFAPPFDMEEHTLVTVTRGETLREIAESLEEARVVRSPHIFLWMVQTLGSAEHIQAGDYAFSEPANVFSVALRMSRADFGLEQVSIRIPEGASRTKIAELLRDTFPLFDAEEFLVFTEGREGYLFPDTYFFLPNVTAPEVVTRLEETFAERIREIEADIVRFGKPFHDIVTMASLIENEVHDEEDRRTVSGILWKRLELEMPLQVDAPFVFLFGKTSAELTREDLEFDSPYNTYVYAGLPPGPIGNPGLDALQAAVTPTETDYLFYLSDEEGTTHYARDFDEHKQNKELYLR